MDDFNGYRHVVVEGNIGSGKTSLAKMLAERWNARLLLETFEDNPFLPKFYEEPERYGFPVELTFLAERYHQKKETTLQTDLFQPKLVADYMFSKSMIFARINLTEDEFELYRTLFQIIHERLPKPDLIVFLHCPPEKALQNIAKRGRSYEESIQLEYLQSINQGYLEYFRTLEGQRLLMIDSSELDFVRNEADFKWLVDAIESPMAEKMFTISP
jgi:deoxyguanosine kinase